MKKSDTLKQERAAKIEAQQDLHDTAEKENRDLTDDEKTQFDELQTEIEALNADISRAEQYEANQRLIASRATGDALGDPEDQEKNKLKKRFSITKMLRHALNAEELDGVEKEMNAIGEAENRNAGLSLTEVKNKIRLHVPLSAVRAEQQTVTQDGGDYGGELVQDQAPRVIDGLTPKLWIEQLGATLLTGLSGGNIPMPVANDYSFEWLAEGADLNRQKNTFNGPVLRPRRAGAAVSLSYQLLMQSSVSVDNIVMRKLEKGWENAINSAAINGAGGNEPTGLLNITGVNLSSVVAATAPDFGHVVELQSLIEEDNATEQSLGYLLHPRLKARLKRTSKDAGSGRFLIDNNELDGYRFVSTSLVPVGDDAGTPVYPLLFGDFAQFYIGQWGGVSFLVNPYSEDIANSVRITVNTHADIQVANPQAFAINTFLAGS
ncbi:MAG: phage major capsid protein [Bacteroidota bacterium]